jgi:hypothetical protein
MKHWEIKVKMSVADSWIADGFDVKDRLEQIEEHIQGLLPYAYGHEVVVKVTIIKQPDAKIIEELQNGEREIKD